MTCLGTESAGFPGTRILQALMVFLHRFVQHVTTPVVWLLCGYHWLQCGYRGVGIGCHDNLLGVCIDDILVTDSLDKVSYRDNRQSDQPEQVLYKMLSLPLIVFDPTEHPIEHCQFRFNV